MAAGNISYNDILLDGFYPSTGEVIFFCSACDGVDSRLTYQTEADEYDCYEVPTLQQIIDFVQEHLTEKHNVSFESKQV